MKIDKENIKIALISFQCDADRVPPMGLVYLATYLRDRAGIKNIKIIDKNFHDVDSEAAKYSPDIIGIAAMTITYGEAIRFAERFKKKNSAPVIIGGVHISSIPESLKPCFDIAVLGEGEETLSELVSLYLKKEKFDKKDLKKIKCLAFHDSGKLVMTPLRKPLELDSLPLPDFDFVEKAYFVPKEIPSLSQFGVKAHILTSRGCPYRCVFCSTSRFWGKVRLHSPEYTAKLVKQAIEKYGADYIAVADDLFTISVERLRAFKKEFEKQEILDKIKGIECQPRANLITDGMCQVMKELKVKVVSFGFESGSDRVLNWLKAGSVTVEMNKKAIVLCRKYGFNVYGSLMFGSPGEKIKDMQKTLDFIDFAIKHRATYVWSFVSTPFPDTPFWDIALKRGKVSNNMDWDLLTHHNLDNPLLLDEEIDRQEFKRIFLKGRRKLMRLKIKMVISFVTKHPFAALKLTLKEPGYYAKRLVKQVFKQ